MVNKFGDDTSYPQGFGISVQIVKKVTITVGKFVDYCNKIIATYRLGFTPYRLTPEITIPVYTYDGKVFSHGSKCCKENEHRGSFQHVRDDDDHIGQVCATETITDKLVTKDDTLVVFERADIDDDGAHVAAIQGDEGETGSEGPAGPDGAVGPEGPARPDGPKGPAGSDGPDAPAGSTGPGGPKGPTGSRGPKGPVGSHGSVDYGYVGIVVAKMLPKIFNLQTIVNDLHMRKSVCWFRIRIPLDNLEIVDERNHVWKWKNEAKYGLSGINAESSSKQEPNWMARYCENSEKIYSRWFLKFRKNAQYKVDLQLSPTCCIFIVYRLTASSILRNRYLMGCNEANRVKPKHPAIGFELGLALNITNGRGQVDRFETFQKTNPVVPAIWHVMCVEWVYQEQKNTKESSVWVNAKKSQSFTSYMINPAPQFIIGGMTMKDIETWWQGDIAHFEVYNSKLQDYEKYFIQRYLCTTYGVPADDQ